MLRRISRHFLAIDPIFLVLKKLKLDERYELSFVRIKVGNSFLYNINYLNRLAKRKKRKNGSKRKRLYGTVIQHQSTWLLSVQLLVFLLMNKSQQFIEVKAWQGNFIKCEVFNCQFLIFPSFLYNLSSDSDSKIGPKIPQVQDQRYQHPHQQGIQHTPPQQPPVYPGYPTHSAQGVPGIPPGPPPAPYPGYVPSSAPFAHQLPGYISPLTTQGTTSQQYSQDRQPIPQQIHRSNPSSGMSASSSAPAPPLPPTPLAMGQSPPAPPAPPTPPLPPIPPSKTGRTIEDEVELSLMIKRQKMDPSVGGGLVSAEEWIELHQVMML
jgi:hypothetical protein